MRLKQLIIKNIGVFSGTRLIDLDHNLTVIYGKNFSGKSTLVRALYFALCGKTLTTGIKQKDIVAAGMNTGTVGITYTIQDDIFRIYRSTKGDIQEQVLRNQIWLPVDSSPLPLLNFHQWQVGCFLKEEELGEFLTQAPANRRDLLYQLLGMGSLMAARDTFVNFRRFVKSAEKSAISKQKALGSGIRHDCRNELNEKLTRIKILEEKIQRITGESENHHFYIAIEKTRSNLSLKRQELLKEITDALSDFKNTTEVNDLLNKLTERLSLRDQYITQITIQQGLHSALANQLKKEDESMITLHKMKDDPCCPICKQTLSKDQLKNLVTDIGNRKQELLNEIGDVEAKEKELNKALDLLNNLAEKHADLKERSIRLQSLNSKLAEIDEQLIKLSSKTDDIDDANGKEYIAHQHELDILNEELKILQTNQALFEHQQSEIQRADYEVCTTEHNRLFSEWITDALDMTIKSTMGVSLRNVGEEIHECLKKFDLLLCQEAKFNLEKTQLLPDLENRSFHALSGSEKAILYLLLKVGISRLIPGADFLILDSPIAYLDSVRREHLRTFLLSLLPEKQIILFTNDLDFANLINTGRRVNL